MTRKTVTRRAALGLLVSGATLSVLNTQAASSVSAERSTTVATTSDATALLSIENTSDVDTPLLFTNRTSYEMSVSLSSSDSSVEFDVNNDGNSDGSNPRFSLTASGTPDSSVDVDVLSDGTVPVTVDADLLDSAGNVVGSITYTRDVETRSQAGQVSVTANVKAIGNSGKYEYELENTGTIDVTLVAIGIYETSNPNVVEVSGGDILFAQGYGSVLNTSIPVDSTDPSTETRRDFIQNVELNTGAGPRTFEFDRFKDAGGNNAKMQNNGDRVEIRIYFSDGSTLDKTLEP